MKFPIVGNLFGKDKKGDKESSLDSPAGDCAEIDIQTSTLTSDVRSKIDDLLENSDSQRLRYFLIELIRKNTGIAMPSVVISENNAARLSVKIPGQFIKDTAIHQIIIEESIKLKQIITDESSITLGNLHITLDSGYLSGGFDIKIQGKIGNSDMLHLQQFFEQRFLKKFLVNEQMNLFGHQVHKMLSLKESDLVVAEDTFLDIFISLDKDIVINPGILSDIAVKLNNSSDDYSVKYKHEELTVQDIKRGCKCKVLCEYKQGKLHILINSYSNLNIDGKFIDIILRPCIHHISENIFRAKNSLQALKDMGVIVFEKNPEDTPKTLEELYMEDGFVGYDDIKAQLAANIIHPWEKREEYLRVSEEEFPHVKNIVPNSTLFEGLPGTGKTTQAKIIGKYLGYPFIYIPIGKLMSKWYGESEGRLDKIFDLAGEAAKENGGIIAMIDEIDEIGKSRDTSNEATGRLTGVLLKKLDGIEQVANILLIGSTNRKDSMDSALLSRFSRQVFFRLPNTQEIRHILTFYIPKVENLSDEVLKKFEGKSGRDLKNIGEDIARKYLEAKIITKSNPDIETIMQEYIDSYA